MCIKESAGNLYKYSRVNGTARVVNARWLSRRRFNCRVSIALDDVSLLSSFRHCLFAFQQ